MTKPRSILWILPAAENASRQPPTSETSPLPHADAGGSEMHTAADRAAGPTGCPWRWRAMQRPAEHPLSGVECHDSVRSRQLLLLGGAGAHVRRAHRSAGHPLR